MRPRVTLTRLIPLALCLLGNSSSFAQGTAAAPPENSAGSFRIAGTVVSKADGHPLASAQVLLASVKDRQKPQSVVTGEDGKFEFTAVPAGKFSLTGTHRGFLSAGYDQHDQYASAIVTGAGLDTENLVLKLAPHTVISGRVLDEVGEPVRHAAVTLYYQNHVGGFPEILAILSIQTDDLGDYDILIRRPGTYFLSVSAQPWYAVHPRHDPNRSAAPINPALDVAYPLTYYPDVADPESATPISVRGGERLQFDIHLNPVPSLHLIVHVPVSDPKQTNYYPPQLMQTTLGDPTPAQNSGTTMISPGTWEITGVPAGRYNVRTMGPGVSSQMNGIDLSSNTHELDVSSTEALCTVKILVTPPESQASNQFAPGLRHGNRVTSGHRLPDSKLQTDFENVPAGRYEVEVWGAGRRFSVAHIAAEGAEVSAHSVSLAPGANASLAVTLTSGSAEVEGTAKSAGKGFAGAMVVLVPKHPEANHELFRRDQSDLDGTFVFHNVFPGAYTVIAIENGWDLDWSQPDVIASYAKHGVPLQVVDKANQNVTLPTAVEVQPK